AVGGRADGQRCGGDRGQRPHPAMTEPPAGGREVRAAGDRSLAAERVSDSVVSTGDHSPIDARRIRLDSAAVPAPSGVDAPAGVHGLPPLGRTPFVGRGDELDQLAAVLESGSGVIAQAVAGLGGGGKTEVALRHGWGGRGGWRHGWACRDGYRLVWWITDDTPAAVEAGLAGLAYRLLPVLQAATTAAEAAGWAVGWLQTHRGCLLVLDNVEQPADILHLLGQVDGTHVLVTTRRDLGWQRYGLVPLRLGVLHPAA